MMDPVVKQIWVPATPETAFRRFTLELDSWWPRATHSVCGKDGVGVRFEPGLGGRIVETGAGGEYVWGAVEEWDEPERLTFTWHPGADPARATRVTVTFREAQGGTRVELTHEGWEALGADAPEVRMSYDSGWDPVLSDYRSGWA